MLLKYFRNIASGDLNALFPNVRVVMSSRDKLMLGLPALAGGIPILLKLYATITVLFLVIGFYLGHRPRRSRTRTSRPRLPRLSGLVALGGFVMRQWVKYQRQSLQYQNELTDNVYFRNINNNAGIFDYLIGAAEEQECKEAFLAYHFLHAAAAPPTADELDGRIEACCCDRPSASTSISRSTTRWASSNAWVCFGDRRMTQLVIFNIFNGLIIGAFYAMMALGLSLILNLSGVINFAHGGFLALGGYLAYTLSPDLGFLGAR